MEFKNNVLDIQTYDEDKIDDGLKIDDEMRPLSKIPEEPHEESNTFLREFSLERSERGEELISENAAESEEFSGSDWVGSLKGGHVSFDVNAMLSKRLEQQTTYGSATLSAMQSVGSALGSSSSSPGVLNNYPAFYAEESTPEESYDGVTATLSIHKRETARHKFVMQWNYGGPYPKSKRGSFGLC